MSQLQISHSTDLKALVDDGYEVTIRADHIVLTSVPYVNAQGEVKRGTLISTLEVNGDVTIRPKQHVTYFSGEHPCDKHGQELKILKHSSRRIQLGDGVEADHKFSCKPADGYRDYHHKMSTYAEIIAKHARAVEPNSTARTYIVTDSEDDGSVFNYADSASTRAGIGAASSKFRGLKIGIVGSGGTGAYVLDLVAKTPVQEIHLFDPDEFLQHNAFRAPGAATREQLQERSKKVEYFATQYQAMRGNIFPHPVYIDEENVNLLDNLDFVFICIDEGGPKKTIVERLEQNSTPFIDVGMGIYLVDEKLLGVVRVTTSTPSQRDHFRSRVGFGTAEVDDVYSENIQVADLNALNAALAVIKWKKLVGFYADLDNEHDCNYTIDGNIIFNGDVSS